MSNPTTYRRELNRKAVKLGYELRIIDGYALVNSSGHIRLYPDLANVANVLETMELENKLREEAAK